MNIEELFKRQSYFGHLKSNRNPELKKFIFCTKHNIDIINLDFTITQIENAKKHVLKFDPSDILFVSRNNYKIPLNINIIKKWKPGMISNFHYGNLEKLPKLIIVDSVSKNLNLVKEAFKSNISIIGICDTNSTIRNIDNYIIMNDDNLKATEFVLDYILN